MTGHLWILLGIVLFSTIEVAAKGMLLEVPPLRMACIRFTLAGLVLLGPAWRALRREDIRLRPKDVGLMAGMGVIGVTVGIGVFHIALQYLQANQAAILFSGHPVFVAALAPWILKEPWTRRTADALAASVAGTAFLLWNGGLRPQGLAAGVMLMLVSMLSFSLYSVMTRRCRHVYPALPLTAISALAGGLALLPLTLVLEQHAAWVFSPATVARLTYLTLAATALAYYAYFRGLQRVPAAQGAQWFFLKPLIASALAWPLLGETVTWPMAVGGALIVAGLLLALRPAPAK